MAIRSRCLEARVGQVRDGRRVAPILLGALLAWATTAAAAAPLPPRSDWTASASSTQVDALAPQHAIDGDPKTRWGGSFLPGHWFQVDLGRPSAVGGVAILWDSGFPVRWTLETSLDGTQWDIAYTSTDSRGDTDLIVFPARSARYVRIASPSKSSDWATSIFEFEPVAADAAPRFEGLAPGVDGAALFATDAAPGVVGTCAFQAAQALRFRGSRRASVCSTVSLVW